jgi:hypothetical protein
MIWHTGTQSERRGGERERTGDLKGEAGGEPERRQTEPQARDRGRPAVAVRVTGASTNDRTAVCGGYEPGTWSRGGEKDGITIKGRPWVRNGRRRVAVADGECRPARGAGGHRDDGVDARK